MTVSARRGFSLVELTVVLGILAALFAAALPRASSLVPRLLLDRAARTLAADLVLARTEAIARNTRVRVIARLEQRRYDVEYDAEGDFVAEGISRALPGGVVFDSAATTRKSGDRVSITFQPRGHTADNATLALAAAGANRRVVVNSAGRVRVE
ncbi:MAG: Type transport protein GspH [Candidatus Binatota bacterium]|nr:Type transport protein GspH [Candidatus Binatota bacterium]